MLQRLSSRGNETLKELRGLLAQKKWRDQTSTFALEGARLCQEAVHADIPIVAAFVTPEARERYPEETNSLLQKAETAYEIPSSIAHWVADTTNPQGLFAVCPQLSVSLENLSLDSRGQYLLLERVQDPGNVGTMIRTAHGLGFSGCILSADSADVFSPKVLRASMGGVLKLPCAVVENMTRTVATLADQGLTVYGAALKADSKILDRQLFSGASALVIGNEGAGISPETQAACHHTVVIPMASGAESLNASIAAGICMWEMRQGRMLEKE